MLPCSKLEFNLKKISIYRRWGVPLIDGGTVRLPRLIGLGRALDLICMLFIKMRSLGQIRIDNFFNSFCLKQYKINSIVTGRAVSAHEAISMGLVSRVVSRGQSLTEAIKLAEQIARL